MYEKFGEFDSAEEINKKAAELLEQGDRAQILVLAKENGIDREYAAAYIAGNIPVLTNCMMAAIGKIEMERKTVKIDVLSGILDDLVNYLLTQCQNDEFAKAVRSKGKSLSACLQECTKKITAIAKKEHEKSGAKSLGFSVRNADIYLMEKEYYLKK